MSDTQAIKDKIDVADLISEYVQLKPAGINKKGLCPFHHEKTPSFMVNSERQSWHCFGCGKGGDIFSFIQEIEGMEFVEALKYLAQKAGIVLDTYRSEINSSQKNRLKEINKEAARFFYNFLIKMPASKPAMDYLIKRCLKPETIDEWQIGFIPEQWDLLTQYLLKKGFGIDDLVASGLTIRREDADLKSGRGFYDRFRGRIMFPIWDIHGEVVGFTGRLLVEKDNSGGKYVNTPQTLIYDKSRVIFGLNKAKQEIKAKDLVVMVEGQMDVIACHQAGMKNVVASSGTALTGHQVHLLQRYSKNLNMAFDADAAGQNAAKRGIDLALEAGMNVKVIKIPDGAGKDPDECLKQNPQTWFQSVEKAQGVMDWLFEKVLKNKNLSDPRQKQTAANELLQQIGLIPYAVEKDHWLRQLSEKLGVDVAVLREDMERLKVNAKIKIEAKTETETKAFGLGHMASGPKTRFDLLVETILAILLKYPQFLSEFFILMPKEVLSTSIYSSLYSELEKQYNEKNTIAIGELQKLFESNQENIIDILLMKGELEFLDLNEQEVRNELEKCLKEIKDISLKNRRKDLQLEIERAEKAGAVEELRELIEKFGKLNN